MDRVRRWLDGLRANFFVLPAAAVIIGYAGARLAVGVDIGSWVGEATVDSARAVLSTVAAATITFASITFSVALLIMQQGSALYSPRVIPGLTRDPFNRRVIAVVVGTFTYCLVVIQRVRAPGGNEEAIVPSFAVALGAVLGLVAVLAVVAAINHTAQQMDVSKILASIVDEATRARTSTPGELRRAAASAPPEQEATEVRFQASGWVRHVDGGDLLGVVPEGGTVELAVVAGRYAIPGTIAARIWPAVDDDALDGVEARVRGAIVLGPTRTMVDDAGYGVRQLVDVALKALSPGVNDPTTAQDAIFHLGTLLVTRLSEELQAPAYTDDHGRLLLVPQAVTAEELAQLAIGELRVAAASSATVSTYLLGMIADVAEAVGPDKECIEPLLHQARLLLADVAHAGVAPHEQATVETLYRRRFAAG